MSVLKKDNNTLMVKCACHTHALEITIDDDGDEDSVPQIYLGIWTYGQRPMPLRWKDRLRWMWYLLKDGRLHADDVVLTSENALAVAKYLANASRAASNKENYIKEKYAKENKKM